MRLRFRNPAALFPLVAAAGALAAQAVALTPAQTVYSPLGRKACAIAGKVDRETGASVEDCPGVGGVKVRVAYDDQRMSITLVLPNGAEQALDLWNVVTRSFSSLGRQAEWRVSLNSGKMEPFALIVRVNDSGNKRSYLAVAKIGSTQACVVQVIPAASADANRLARESADQSASKPCLEGK